jgi:hypothetical protein
VCFDYNCGSIFPFFRETALAMHALKMDGNKVSIFFISLALAAAAVLNRICLKVVDGSGTLEPQSAPAPNL